MIQLKVGQWLHASCSDEWYGPIIRVGKDANDADVIDIRLPLNDFLTYDHFGGQDENVWPLTQVLKADNAEQFMVAADYMEERGWKEAADFLRQTPVTALFVDLMWKPVDDRHINLNPPGDTCYRCTQYFSVYDKKMVGDEWRAQVDKEWRDHQAQVRNNQR